MDDAGLLDRMRRGDQRAFAALFDRHKTSIYRYAAHMGGIDEADDIVQEVFMALLRQLSQYDAARGSVQAYLLGIARRQVLKRFSALRLNETLDENGDESASRAASAGDPFADLNRTEIVERVRAAVAALPPVFREAVVLCELNELDYASAAGVMNCPIGTVRSRLHRGRAMLAERLAQMRTGALSTHGR